MAAHEAGRRKGASLTWTAWPARERPLAAVVLIGAAVVLGVLIARETKDGVLGVAAPAIVLASLSSFLFPTHYRLTDESVEVRSIGMARVRPWSEMKRMTVDRTGVFLSPFARRHWLEAYRGMRLLFATGATGATGATEETGAAGEPGGAGAGGGNRDQVVAFVETRLGRGGAAT